MNYKTIQNAVSTQQCQTLLADCRAQYDQVSADRPDLQYPTRLYPGVLLPNQTAVLNELTVIAAQTAPEFNAQFDLGAGTAASYVNAQSGELIGEHYDRPINGEEGRICSLTVMVALTDGGQIKIGDDIIDMLAGMAVVLKGNTTHELLPVADTCNIVAGFFCTNGE